MSVVNVKVKYIRHCGYDNLKEWMCDPNNIYIGRAGIVFIEGERFPKESSPFCNPFKIDKDGDRQQVISMYETYIRNNPKLISLLKDLKGKTLGCWCKPEMCHGDVLLKLINELFV